MSWMMEDNKTSTFLFWAGLYLLCSACAYLLYRHNWRSQFNSWSKGDRLTMLALSCLGPLSLTAALVVYLSRLVSTKFDTEGPASW